MGAGFGPNTERRWGALAALALPLVALASTLAGCDAASQFVSGDRENVRHLGGPADDSTRALYAGALTAEGRDPDWRLVVEQDWAALYRAGQAPQGGAIETRDIRSGGARLDAGPLAITIIATPCIDPESSETANYRTFVVFRGRTLTGCARRDARSVDKPWQPFVGEHLPALDACLAKLNDPRARLFDVRVAAPGDVADMRLIMSDGRTMACRARRDGAHTIEIEELTAPALLAPPDAIVFTRAPEPPPGGPCYSNELIARPNGAAIGQMSVRKPSCGQPWRKGSD